MKLHHLSHIDLDGYGCQFLSNQFFKDSSYYNSNYGKEVVARLEQIFSNIEQENFERFLILITDLNLTTNEAEMINQFISQSSKDVDVQLLDHHATGSDCAELFKWYFLDTERSATKITFEWLCKNFKGPQKKRLEKLKELVNSIDSYDIWREEDKGFEFGKVCSKSLNEAREINRFMFDDMHRIYKFHILESALNYIKKDNRHIKLDSSIHKIKKEFLKNSSEDDTLENLTSIYLIKLLGDELENITIYYKEHKGVLTYSLGSISVVANGFLKKYKDYDFFMDISPRGALSIRADGELDVGNMSKTIFGGGGHPNAAGGKMSDFKESFLYSEVKSRVQNIIIQKG